MSFTDVLNSTSCSINGFCTTQDKVNVVKICCDRPIPDSYSLRN